MKFFPRFLVSAISLCLALSAFTTYGQQPPSGFEKERGRMMLAAVKDDLKKNYYDPQFHGMDIDARFKAADDKIKAAQSLGQIFGIIAQVLVELNDSHTTFIPPGRTNRTDYGWLMQAIGDKVYLTAVKPGSDADVKGLREGDEVYSIDELGPQRDNLWKINYMYRTLRPRPGVRMVVIKPDGKEQQVDVLAKVQTGKKVTDLTSDDIWDLVREGENENRLNRHRYIEMGQEVLIWKMPQFDMSKADVDAMADKFKKKKALILDLRGNPGGLIDTLLRLLGNVLDHDVTIDEKRRKESKPLVARTRGADAFKGQIIVLVDSRSASCSEIFARIMQLEKRGVVIGDRTAGAVMEARRHPHQVGVDVVAFYGVSITEADLIMSDGKSLEHVGVTPDKLMLPTARDLAGKKDPALAHAISLMGLTITAEKAGTMFPIEWGK